MERFPALNLIVKFGAIGAAGLAISSAILLALLLWPLWGAASMVAALLVGAIAYLVAKSFVELVIILTEMLVPR